MDNGKLFEFMEKIYVELQSTRNEMQQGFAGIKKEQAEMKEDIKKNSIKLDSLEKKVDTIAEVQKSHMNQNENQHVEIVEMVSEKIDIQDKAIKKLSVVK